MNPIIHEYIDHKLGENMFRNICKCLFLFVFFFVSTGFAKEKIKQLPIECRLIEANIVDVELIKSEFEAIEGVMMKRSKKRGELWNGIPIKNDLGKNNTYGLQLANAIENNKMKKCYPTKYLKQSPYIQSILNWIEERFETEVGLVRIFKLPAHRRLNKHRDRLLFNIYTGSVCRLHVPIITSSKVKFIINNKIFTMNPGNIYFTDVSNPHYVVNNGDEDRIQMVVDVQANDKIREFILNEAPKVKSKRKKSKRSK